jgi:hypothetical protein
MRQQNIKDENVKQRKFCTQNFGVNNQNQVFGKWHLRDLENACHVLIMHLDRLSLVAYWIDIY